MVEKIQNCVRWSPTLGNLESTHQKVWGTKNYNPKTDIEKPCVFFGLYGLPDFYALWRHKGKRWILWAGTDITHFVNGYWLDEKGKIKLCPKSLAKWINRYCESWVENEVEAEALEKIGIKTKICPSFLGDVNKFKICYKPSDRPKIYASCSGNEFEKYGWYEIENLAWLFREYDFYLYGNTKPFKTGQKNVIIRGRIPKDVMNREIKEMQCGLRLLEFDGFSEVLAKSILWGQWPISTIKYPHILSITDLPKLKDLKKPNIAGRDYYLKKLNAFPWNLT